MFSPSQQKFTDDRDHRGPGHRLRSILILGLLCSHCQTKSQDLSTKKVGKERPARALSMMDLTSEAPAGLSSFGEPRSHGSIPPWRPDSTLPTTPMARRPPILQLADPGTPGSNSPLGRSAASSSLSPSESPPTGAIGSEATCQDVLTRMVPRYRSLYRALSPEAHLTLPTPLEKLLRLKASFCQTAKSHREALQLADEVLNRHRDKIGIILPAAGRLQHQTAHIVQGLRAAFLDLGLDFDRHVILKDSTGAASSAEARLAELVFKDQASMIVGGVDQNEAEILAEWSASLKLPTVLLTSHRDLISLSRTLFSVYPDPKRLAEALVTMALIHGKRKIAILRPNHGRADRLISYLKDALAQRGGSVMHEITYTPGQFDSMQYAVKQLFKIDAPERAAELREAYLKAKELAAKEGVPFNAKGVLLKPVVDFDGLFLPDDFRSVRHFTKLLKYHMVPPLTLMGHHEWRSSGLISPPEEYLQGSFFADVVGPYTSLPRSIGQGLEDSPWFAGPAAASIDFRLIGYRTGQTLGHLVKKAPSRRDQIAPILGTTRITMVQPGASSLAFDSDRHSHWPIAVFRIAKDRLELLSSPQNSL